MKPVYLQGQNRFLKKVPVIIFPRYRDFVVKNCFTGYFVAGLTQEKPLSRRMEEAAKAAAVSVTRPGWFYFPSSFSSCSLYSANCSSLSFVTSGYLGSIFFSVWRMISLTT